MVRKSYRQQAGFTLIEVMITVVVVAILASIAYPSYTEYLKRGYRAEGQAFLNEVAARQERYFAQNNEYITSNDDIDKLNLKDGSTSETGKYELSIGQENSDGGYTLTAQEQFNDNACGDLTLNAVGVKGNSGSKSVEDCWK